MNISSTSSFLGYVNSTSTGGNSLYTLNEINTYFIDDGKIEVPNQETLKAINEVGYYNTVKFDNIEECLQFLND